MHELINIQINFLKDLDRVGEEFFKVRICINSNQLFKMWETIKITSSSSRKSSSRRDNCASISASTFFCCSTRSLYLFCVISSVSVSVKIRLKWETGKTSHIQLTSTTHRFLSLLGFNGLFNPLTPKISLVIILTVCHIVLVTLVWRIWYWIHKLSPS